MDLSRGLPTVLTQKLRAASTTQIPIHLSFLALFFFSTIHLNLFIYFEIGSHAPKAGL